MILNELNKENITKADLELVIQNNQIENLNIEYKSTCRNSNDRILSSFAGFAFTDGGSIIFGVDDNTKELSGITDNVKTLENEILSLGQIIQDNINPKPSHLLYKIIPVKLENNHYGIVLNIEKDFLHIYNVKGRFYKRTSEGRTVPLGGEEIQQFFHNQVVEDKEKATIDLFHTNLCVIYKIYEEDLTEGLEKLPLNKYFEGFDEINDDFMSVYEPEKLKLIRNNNLRYSIEMIYVSIRNFVKSLKSYNNKLNKLEENRGKIINFISTYSNKYLTHEHLDIILDNVNDNLLIALNLLEEFRLKYFNNDIQELNSDITDVISKLREFKEYQIIMVLLDKLRPECFNNDLQRLNSDITDIITELRRFKEYQTTYEKNTLIDYTSYLKEEYRKIKQEFIKFFELYENYMESKKEELVGTLPRKQVG